LIKLKSKYFQLLLIILCLLTIFLLNQDNVKNQLDSQVKMEILSFSYYIPDEITPLCRGVLYDDSKKMSLSNVKNLNVNVRNKSEWYQNLFSVIQESPDYIFEKRKKTFDGEVVVLFDNNLSCSYNAEIRLSGDHQDHIRKYSLDTTVDIRLLEGNIDGIVRFKLFLPETRKGDTELIVTTLMEKLDFLVPRTNFVMASINNQKNINYIFQEKVSKEFLEHNGFRESILLETSEEFFWENRKLLNPEKAVLYSKSLNNSWSNRTPYNQVIAIEALDKLNELIFQSNGSYLQYKHKDYTQLQLFDAVLYALDGNHGLALHNRKFLYDNVRDDLVPIYYDSDSQILLRDMKIESCDNIEDNIYYETMCRNNVSQGAKKIIDKIHFDHQDIYQDLLDKKINIEFSKVKEVFDKFYLNLSILSESGNITYETTNTPINNFKLNYLYNSKSSSIGFYFVDLVNKKIKYCNSNLSSCFEEEVSVMELKNKINKDSIDYFLLGSINQEKLYGIQDRNIYNIEKSIYIETFGEKSEILVNSKSKEIIINMKKKSKLLFFGNHILKDWQITINGSKNNPIDEFRQDENSLTGCVTFYGLEVDNISIFSENNNCEDAINLLNVNGFINRVEILGSNSDALDIDFSNLIIESINIADANNDCLDISGSNIKLNHGDFNNCLDKSVSVGEVSKVEALIIEANNSNIGLAIKDSSFVEIKKFNARDNNICIAMYRKKQEFGPSRLLLSENSCYAKYEDFFQIGQEVVYEN
jgi:hypothetical protein